MIIEARGVRRQYGRHRALRGIDLQIKEGEVVGLLGRNGAGKTTFLKMLTALLRPTSGEVRVFGEEPFAAQERILADTGTVSENESIPDSVRISDLLAVHRQAFPRWDEAHAQRIAGTFGLALDKRRFKDLSKGEKRQVQLICALAHHPPLLILDEPAGGLDPVVRREFLEILLASITDEATTVLFSSHHFADVERLAERVVLLDKGEVLADAAQADLLSEVCRCRLAAASLPRLGELPILSRQPRGDEVEVVVRLSPATMRQRLQAANVVGEVAALGLEDLFISWTRSSR